MLVTVNGQPHDLPDGTSIHDLIRSLGLDKSACAAELNKHLVPKRQHLDQRLAEGDTIELVSLVGGG